MHWTVTFQSRRLIVSRPRRGPTNSIANGTYFHAREKIKPEQTDTVFTAPYSTGSASVASNLPKTRRNHHKVAIEALTHAVMNTNKMGIPHSPSALQFSIIEIDAFIAKCAIPSSTPREPGYTHPIILSNQGGGGSPPGGDDGACPAPKFSEGLISMTILGSLPY